MTVCNRSNYFSLQWSQFYDQSDTEPTDFCIINNPSNSAWPTDAEFKCKDGDDETFVLGCKNLYERIEKVMSHS